MATDYEYPRIDTIREFLSLVREDWATNLRDWREPGFQALLMYRIGLLSRSRRVRVRGPRRILRLIYRWMHWRIRKRHGIELHDSARIGRRLAIRHQSNIVVDYFVQIGHDCMIRQGVTLGGANPEWTPGVGPKVGCHVSIGANAVVVGDVTIGDGAQIGPNVNVFFDVPEGATVVAQRPRVIERKHAPERADRPAVSPGQPS